MAITKFDDIFQYIGEFGPYQWKLLALVCYYNCILIFNYYGQIFLVLTPPHWCSPHPDLRQDIWESFSVNLTDEDIVKLTIPPSKEGHGIDKCSRYDVNISQIDSLEDTNSTNWTITGCTYGWTYNFTEYYPSLTSELNWVCDDDWKPPTAQAIFFTGCVVGGPIFGWLADHLGRLPIIIAVNTIGGTFMVLSTVASSFATFCFVRFVVGMTHDSDFMLLYILALEYVSPKYRTVMSNIPLMIFLTGASCVLPWIPYYVRDWRIFGILIALPSFISIILPWLIPESLRWLVANGKKEKALEVVKAVAKFNRKELSKENSEHFMAFMKEQETKDCKQKITWMDILKSPRICRWFIALAVMWAAIYTAYDGLVRVSENSGFNFFVTFTIMGFLELPSDLLVVFLMEYVGRKHTAVWSLITCGIATMSVVFIAEDDVTSIMIAAIIGRFFVTMAINLGMAYILEVLPTQARARGSCAIHTLGIATTFSSPYIVYLGKYRHWAPYFTIGLISLIGGLVSLMLPETLGEKLPDTLEDGEAAFQNQHICYNPWRRKEKSSTEDAEQKTEASIEKSTDAVKREETDVDEGEAPDVVRRLSIHRPSIYFATPLRRMSVFE